MLCTAYKDIDELNIPCYNVPTTFSCNLCDHTSKSKHDIKSHKVNVHGIGVNWYQCTTCVYKTKRSSDLNRHRIAKHGNDTRSSLYCALCAFNTKDIKGLIVHSRSHDDN